MARLITLSRAARLVGVKRTNLQKQIQAGELSTFEGQLDLSELLRVYPQTKIEDSAMIERADRMIERALSRVVRDQEGLPDAFAQVGGELREPVALRLHAPLGGGLFRFQPYLLRLQVGTSGLQTLQAALASVDALIVGAAG